MLGKSGSIFLSILVHSTWACVEKFFQFKFKFIRDLQQCRAVAMDCFRSICNAASSSATWQPRFQWKTPQCREQKQCNCEPFLGHSQRRVSSYVYCGGSPLKDYGVSISPLASSLGPSTRPRPSRKNPRCPVFFDVQSHYEKTFVLCKIPKSPVTHIWNWIPITLKNRCKRRGPLRLHQMKLDWQRYLQYKTNLPFLDF